MPLLIKLLKLNHDIHSNIKYNSGHVLIMHAMLLFWRRVSNLIIVAKLLYKGLLFCPSVFEASPSLSGFRAIYFRFFLCCSNLKKVYLGSYLIFNYNFILIIFLGDFITSRSPKHSCIKSVTPDQYRYLLTNSHKI